MAESRKSFKAPAFQVPPLRSRFDKSEKNAAGKAIVEKSEGLDGRRVQNGGQKKTKEVLGELEIHEGHTVSKKSVMSSMNNAECSETSGVAGLSLTTPPTVRRRPMPTPKAPLKMRKQFDKNILKPKKLLYTDRENENSEEQSSSVVRTPMKKQKGQLRNRADDTSSKEQAHQNDEQAVSSLKSQGTKKKNAQTIAEEIKKVKKANVGKGELNINKENNGNLGREKDGTEKKMDSDKGANNGKKQIFYRGRFMKTDPKFSYLANREGSANSSELSRLPTDERGSRLYDVPLSQPDSNLDWLDHLKWLQARRDIGLWVECCAPSCGKWRYIDEIHDPLDVPKEWFCHMNSDKTLAACSAPERPFPPQQNSYLIDNEYNAGSIVFAKVVGYPWWPAMVDDCPDVAQYFWLDGFSNVPTMYNVTFFHTKHVSRKWLERRSIQPFAGNNGIPSAKKHQFHGIYTRKTFNAAHRLAESALALSIQERLQKYSFISRYEGPICDPRKNPTVLKLTQEFLNNAVLTSDKNKLPQNDCETEERPEKIRKQKEKTIKTSTKVHTSPKKSANKTKGSEFNDINDTRSEKVTDKGQTKVQSIETDDCIIAGKAVTENMVGERPVNESIQNKIDQQNERSSAKKTAPKKLRRASDDELHSANTEMNDQEMGSEERTELDHGKSVPLVPDTQKYIETNDLNDTCSIYSSILNDSLSPSVSVSSYKIHNVPTKKSMKSEDSCRSISRSESSLKTRAQLLDNSNVAEMSVSTESNERNSDTFRTEVDDYDESSESKFIPKNTAEDKIENRNLREERDIDEEQFDADALSEDEICSSQSNQSAVPSKLSFILEDIKRKNRMEAAQNSQDDEIQVQDKHSPVTHLSNATNVKHENSSRYTVQITQADSTSQVDRSHTVSSKIMQRPRQAKLRGATIKETKDKKSPEVISKYKKSTNVRKRSLHVDENDVPSTSKIVRMNTNETGELHLKSRHEKYDIGKKSQSDPAMRQSSSPRNKQLSKRTNSNVNVNYSIPHGTVSEQNKLKSSDAFLVRDDVFSESLQDICNENMKNFRASLSDAIIDSEMVSVQERYTDDFEKISKNLSMASSSEFVLLRRDSSFEDLHVSGVSLLDSMEVTQRSKVDNKKKVRYS